MRKIGIPFWKVGDNSFGITLSYLMFAEKLGEVVPLMPIQSIREDLDLIILPGGADVDPLRYNEVPHYMTGKADMFKEYFDTTYLPQYINAGIPIFGICRGHQALAVHFGGKLIQHMDHETNDINRDPYSAQHELVFTPEFHTRNLFTEFRAVPVNSRHHQAVDPQTLPAELVVLGTHRSFGKHNQQGDSDGTIEMMAHATLPIVSMQMHPEDTIDISTNRMVRRVINHLMQNKTSII